MVYRNGLKQRKGWNKGIGINARDAILSSELGNCHVKRFSVDKKGEETGEGIEGEGRRREELEEE